MLTVGLASGLMHEYWTWIATPQLTPPHYGGMLAFFLIHSIGLITQRLFTVYSPIHLPSPLSWLLTLAFLVWTLPLFFAGFGIDVVETARLSLENVPIVAMFHVLMFFVDGVEQVQAVAGLLGEKALSWGVGSAL
jgi:hypothetical protein